MMKNALSATALALSLLISGAAFAGEEKPVKPAKPEIDLTTTGSTDAAKDCMLIKSSGNDQSVCAKAEMFPSNGLSGLNLN